MPKTAEDYLETLVSLCTESLELNPKGSIKPIQVTTNINATQSIGTVNWSLFYEEYKDTFLSGERQWFLENEMKINNLDVGYCVSFAEKNLDTDLATTIIYYIYMCIDASEVVKVEEEKKRITDISSALKSLVNDKDSSTFGPTGIDFSAIQNGMPNINNMLTSFMPAMQSMMESSEFKEFIKIATPSNINPGQPPDITQILGNTMTAFSTDAGKNFFNKVSTDLSSIANKK